MAVNSVGNTVIDRKYKIDVIEDMSGNFVGVAGQNRKSIFVANANAGGSGYMLPASGNISTQISATGVQPGATGADNVLAVFSLPANAFDGASGTNRGIVITAMGTFGATANNKRIKLLWNPSTAVVGSTVGSGGTLLADTGTVATNGGGWLVSGNVYKYGVANSNTQFCTSNGAIAGASHAGISAPAAATATENAPILIAVTGNATTAATDILFQFLEITFMD